jgi:hypothetical protein
MAFDTIAYVGPVKSGVTLPTDGVKVYCRQLTSRKGTVVRYINIQIGAGVAKKLAMHRDIHEMQVQLGRDNDAGKVALMLDTTGNFVARKAKKAGSYTLTINELSATGRFALEFDAFTRDNVETVKMQSGAFFCAFLATKGMLAVEG